MFKQKALKDKKKVDKFLSKNCQTGLYMYVLFTQGYGFTPNTTKIMAKDFVEGKSIGTCFYSTHRSFYYNIMQIE